MIYYNGKSLADFGLKVDHSRSYTSPERSTAKVQVPGRNGDIIIDDGSYNNVTLKYKCAIMAGFKKRYEEMLNFLYKDSAYHRLEDTTHPDFYRVAAINAAPEYETTGNHRSGNFTLSFDCKPQKFLKSGERKKILTSAGSLRNPTAYKAKPIITVKGSGAVTLTVGAYNVAIANLTSAITIDCEQQDCYWNGTNLNNGVTLDDFPVLLPGTNSVSWSGSVTSVEIIPHFWEL